MEANTNRLFRSAEVLPGRSNLSSQEICFSWRKQQSLQQCPWVDPTPASTRPPLFIIPILLSWFSLPSPPPIFGFHLVKYPLQLLFFDLCVHRLLVVGRNGRRRDWPRTALFKGTHYSDTLTTTLNVTGFSCGLLLWRWTFSTSSGHQERLNLTNLFTWGQKLYT